MMESTAVGTGRLSIVPYLTMFEPLKEQLTGASEKLTQLRRFL